MKRNPPTDWRNLSDNRRNRLEDTIRFRFGKRLSDIDNYNID